MKECLECKTTNPTSWRGKYCSKCASKIYRLKNPNYDKDQYQKYGKKFYEKIKDINIEERRAQARTRYSENKDQINLQHKIHRIENKDQYKKLDAKYKRQIKYRFNAAKLAAHRRKLEWNISIDDYSNLIKLPCNYCKNLFGKQVETGIGLDRLDNSLGYQFTNVVSCCRNCNVLRSNLLSPEETTLVVELIIKLRNNN